MKARFGPRYEAWAKDANLFFPRIKKIEKFNFNIALYMKNREYRVLFYSLFIIVGAGAQVPQGDRLHRRLASKFLYNTRIIDFIG